MSSRGLRRVGITLFIAFVTVACVKQATAQATLPIGQIQGRGSESEYLERRVNVRGIVSGILEDENSRGVRFYTAYIQDLPGSEDGDPLTSDGMAIFLGARRPSVAVGDVVWVSGRVTEFYGLTELDNNDLQIIIESRSNPLPEPAEIYPPANNAESATYLERFESMRVSLPVSVVVGPAHIGCGFSVVPRAEGVERVIVREPADPAGQVIGVLHRSDVNCDAMPDVAQGDEVVGLDGPLTYHFDRFKIVYQDPAVLSVRKGRPALPAAPPEAPPGGFVIATFNVNDFFDTVNNTGQESEPKLSEVEYTLKTSKVAAAISDRLGCPELLGLQEIENREVLHRLVLRLSTPCGFEYEISHLESPDARGAEQALLSDPRKVEVGRISLRQACSELDTGVVDSGAACEDGQQPLFSRPPLQIDTSIDGRHLVILVNHFKSKRDGAAETAPRRLAQAQHLNQIVAQLHAADPDSYLIVLGDFNDYDGSEVMETMRAGLRLVDALAQIPDNNRYSYVFDGMSQLIDWILVSPPLVENIVEVSILHNNADYPFKMGELGDSANLSIRSSDHDVPYIVLDFEIEKELAPTLSAALPTSPPRPTAQAPIDQMTTDALSLTTSSLAQTGTRPGDDSAEAVQMPEASKVVEAQDNSVSKAVGSGLNLVWIIALAVAVAIAGAMAMRVRR